MIRTNLGRRLPVREVSLGRVPDLEQADQIADALCGLGQMHAGLAEVVPGRRQRRRHRKLAWACREIAEELRA